MAINKNHEFEELDGVKCAIVEKNVLPSRVDFLQKLLSFNNYTVMVVASPAPKTAVPSPAPAGAEVAAETAATPEPALLETFTVGVTDVMFNVTNAIFGRLLKTPDGHVVTLAYWKQKESIAHDEVPYYENKL